MFVADPHHAHLAQHEALLMIQQRQIAQNLRPLSLQKFDQVELRSYVAMRSSLQLAIPSSFIALAQVALEEALFLYPFQPHVI